MDVEIKHNGSNVTSHTVRYDREHKICTGIGMLDIEFDSSLFGSFDPWDTISIYEGGSLAGTYYVSVAADGEPNSTVNVTAQDNSKRLNDYFIAESYLIDYPSYTRFWIEFFLDEVGINYKFVVKDDDMGSLLSSNTALGLTSAYEQIMMLLQMSGWYITFEPSGKAKIGKANVDFGTKGGSVNESNLINMMVDTNDGMYRNRIVVWGNGDPKTNHWVFADVSTTSPWDYGKYDKRTVVISNSGIPTVADAFALASKALLEFSKITVEKHFSIEGTRHMGVGDTCGVRSLVWSGKGLITTYGSSMSKEGLITNISLDERCPRLFAFYDITGFVYAGTFGDGVWRHHLLPNWSGGDAQGSGLIGFASGLYNFSGWFNYSSGLMDDLCVTDLHVNAGVLTCVTTSGAAYYSLEDDIPWTRIPISELSVTGSGAMDTEVYTSGIMARACIIDRSSNNIRIVVDNRSGVNLGDFLLETDPLGDYMMPAFEYVLPPVDSGSYLSSGIYLQPMSGLIMRSWVIDVNTYSGIYASGVDASGVSTSRMSTTSYSISESGNFNFYAFDIDNDGLNDYVSAVKLMSGDMPADMVNGSYESASPTMHPYFPDYTDASTDLWTYMPYSGIMYPEIQFPNSIRLDSDQFVNLFFPSVYDYMPDFGYVSRCSLNTPDTRYVVDYLYYDYSDTTISGGILSTNRFEVVESGRTYAIASGEYEILTSRSNVENQANRFYGAEFYYYSRPWYTSNIGDGQVYGTGINADYGLSIYKTTVKVDHSVGSTTVITNTSATDILKGYHSERYIESRGALGHERTMAIMSGDYLYNLRISAAAFGFSVYLDKIDVIRGVLLSSTLLTTAIGTSDLPATGYYYTNPNIAMFPIANGEVKIIIPYIKAYKFTAAYGDTKYKASVLRFIYNSTTGYRDTSTVVDWSFLHPTLYIDSSTFYYGFLRTNYSDGHLGYADLAGNFNDTDVYFAYTIGISGTNIYNITDTFNIVNVAHSTTVLMDQYSMIYPIKGTTGLSKGIVYGIEPCVGKIGSGLWYIDRDTGQNTTQIIPRDPNITLIDHTTARDSFNGEHYFRASIDPAYPDELYIVTLNSYGYATRISNSIDQNKSPYVSVRVIGNFRLSDYFGGASVNYYEPPPIPGYYPVYEILQRSGEMFTPIYSGFYRERVEISNYAPIVTMDRRVASLATYFVSKDGSVLRNSNMSVSGWSDETSMSGGMFNLGILGDDYRYAYTDYASISGVVLSGVTESGMGGGIFVAYSGTVGVTDMSDLAVFTEIFSASGVYMSGVMMSGGVTSSGTQAQGYATRIEVSNYKLPAQYVFVAVSGYSIIDGEAMDTGYGFFMREPASGTWVDYSSGYPQAYTTIIRLDDRI